MLGVPGEAAATRRWDWGRVASLTCWLARRRRGEAGGFGWREQGGWSVRRSSIYGGGPPRSAAAVLPARESLGSSSFPARRGTPPWSGLATLLGDGEGGEGGGEGDGEHGRGAAGEIDEAGERLE